jgi:hypothetical protein
MAKKNNLLSILLIILVVLLLLVIFVQRKSNGNLQHQSTQDTLVQTIYDTIYQEKIVRDTVVKTKIKTRTQISYVDTTPIVLNQKRSFIYIKDTFNIDERTYYITEKGDTVKAFYSIIPITYSSIISKIAWWLLILF